MSQENAVLVTGGSEEQDVRQSLPDISTNAHKTDTNGCRD